MTALLSRRHSHGYLSTQSSRFDPDAIPIGIGQSTHSLQLPAFLFLAASTRLTTFVAETSSASQIKNSVSIILEPAKEDGIRLIWELVKPGDRRTSTAQIRQPGHHQGQRFGD
jgi:hypothetical protein